VNFTPASAAVPTYGAGASRIWEEPMPHFVRVATFYFSAAGPQPKA
jgi:hypothetical protein